ncbi:hypothetical protein CDG77_21505, partial [Nostoc sp. 'Peltigera membranacea cyanobiont' 213]|uniref:hypothetical protein n=1 Tax=Nostoc sp. 'Peltigera membranacea cyanobiont' 213 TaxID=2014530 RepID=UPI000B9F1ED6
AFDYGRARCPPHNKYLSIFYLKVPYAFVDETHEFIRDFQEINYLNKQRVFFVSFLGIFLFGSPLIKHMSLLMKIIILYLKPVGCVTASA